MADDVGPAMIDECRKKHRVGRIRRRLDVADAAILADRDMIRGLTECAARFEIPVVARNTIVGNPGMVEGIRHERSNSVAQVTILVGWQVTAVLEAGRISGEEEFGVTALAAPRNNVMNGAEESGRFEIDSRIVANAAIFLGRDVIEFLRRRQAGIVTRRAIVRIYALVVIGNPGESRVVERIVANRAIVAGHNVRRRRIGLARGDRAVVAQRAISDVDAGVIPGRRHDGGRGMAVLATCCRR